MVHLIQAFVAVLLTSNVVAHPGGNTNREIKRRIDHLNHPNRRSVQECKRDLVDAGWVREQHQRREERLHELRVEAGFAKRGELVRRNVEEVEKHYGKRAACTLDVELTEGPYWVAGELIREDILSGQEGVITHVDVNLIDVSTCKPVPNAYVELWGSNSTGVYGGVQARTNGDGSSDLNSNALRGVQPTGPNGTASFITIIPGHYEGRTNHLHTIVHHNAELLPNNTIAGGSISHVGQFFFEDQLRNEVEAYAPYNLNEQPLMTNSQDGIFNWSLQGGDVPLMQVSLIGNEIKDGLYATIDVGVNPLAVQKPSPVNYWTSHGGVPNPGSPYAGMIKLGKEYDWYQEKLSEYGEQDIALSSVK
ncbi:aromatic compound dioxygenase [Curvularia clavata]|uniref:Aromatic compound dioxygenase n=1 Tax=Curvularia clavata TaxID=95742 RepID=A0A9Q8Z4R3_CURCL|nr:aromatic compound dioxygenase [Curvularia clavata]